MADLAEPVLAASAARDAAEAFTIGLTLNGVPRTIHLDDPRVTLLDLLRERLGLTGAKKGCDRGQCGACTVLLDGRRVNACLILAMTLEGAAVETIEGLGAGGTLHPLQAAFVEHDALQCGFCTPGQIMSALGLLAENGDALDPERIRAEMSGNLCRCGAHPAIVAAIRSVMGVEKRPEGAE